MELTDFLNPESLSEFYLRTLCLSTRYFSDSPVSGPSLLFPDFAKKIDSVISGYNEIHPSQCVFIFESFRSNSLQRLYYLRGNSKIRRNGMHHYGIAADLVYLDDLNHNGLKDAGEYVSWEKLDYSLLKKLADAEGLSHLTWESCHFQLIPVALQEQLRAYVAQSIVSFQSAYGLLADGIVGPKTVDKLNEVYG